MRLGRTKELAFMLTYRNEKELKSVRNRGERKVMVVNLDTFGTWLSREEEWYNQFLENEPKVRIETKETIFDILKTINESDSFHNIKSRFIPQNESEYSSGITIGGEYGLDEIDVDLVLGEKSDDILQINSLMNRDGKRRWLVEYNGVKRGFIDTKKLLQYLESI